MLSLFLELRTSIPNTVWDGLWGAVGGGVIGAWMTIRAERRRSRTEVALTFMEQFIAKYDDLAEVMGLLADPASIQSAEQVNRIRKFGDWCEIVSATVLADAADRELLKTVGIPEQMKAVYNGVVDISKKEPEWKAALGGWTNLARYVKGW